MNSLPNAAPRPRVSKFLLDASAVLAYLNREPGAEQVGRALFERPCLISSVNLTEVLTRLMDWGMSLEQAWTTIEDTNLHIIEYGTELARATAGLRPTTRHLGLSLGDRACLATAQHLNATVLTADRIWLDLAPKIDIRIECARP